MAISNNTMWEVRAAGVETNGGGFKDLNPGTSVDYSQQDAAQLALTDLVSDGAGTGITSVTGGFTAAMEGNCIYIAGTGWTTGWYQITGYTDTNTITIDRSAAANQTGGTGNVGGAWLFESSLNATFFNTTNKSTYNTVWVKSGTYTGATVLGSSSWSLARSYFKLQGYVTTRGDFPIGTDRPLLDFGVTDAGISFTGTYVHLLNMRMDKQRTSGSRTMYMAGTSSVMRNCKITRSGYNTAACIMGGTYARVFQCEFVSTLGQAFQFGQEYGYMSFCYIHDSASGVSYSGGNALGCTVANSIIDTCTGAGIALYYGGQAFGNTIYNCATGFSVSSTFYTAAVNNIFHSCTTALAAKEDTYSDNNCFYNNGTDRSGGVVAGENDISANPLLTDPANQDFSLATSSPCFDTAAKLGAAVGLP